jgi:hypothetical protein
MPFTHHLRADSKKGRVCAMRMAGRHDTPTVDLSAVMTGAARQHRVQGEPHIPGPSKRLTLMSRSLQTSYDGKRIARPERRVAAQKRRWLVTGSLRSGCGPGEKELATEIVPAGQDAVRDLTGPDLRNAILALAAANAAVSNDSGLLHVAAALGTPAIGIFGPTSPWHWAPLNPIAAVVETASEFACRPCHKPICRFGHHRCMRDIPVNQVAKEVHGATSGCEHFGANLS